MSLELSSNIEAEIIAKARNAGVSVESYLVQLVRQSEEMEGILQETGFHSDPGSQEEARAKIDRGLQQLERGDVVDGEQFMMELMSGIEDSDHRQMK